MGAAGIAVLYDADCGFCRWVIALLLRGDPVHHLAAIRIQSNEGQRLLEPVPEGERLESWHVVTPDGCVRSGGAALPPVLRALPGGHLVAWLPAALPGLSDRGYRWVARHRSSVSRLVPRRAKVRADALLAERSGGDVTLVGVTGRC